MLCEMDKCSEAPCARRRFRRENDVREMTTRARGLATFNIYERHK
jgi:hypothetical protein